MSIREQFHRLVDVLPEAEAGAALRFLEYPRDAPSPFFSPADGGSTR